MSRLSVIVGLVLCLGQATTWRAEAAALSSQPVVGRPSHPDGYHAARFEPWVEGVDPRLEDRLFYATYGTLQSHNVLKVYVFSAGGYESAGIRFSGRVPHEERDLTVGELAREAVTLIRTTFDEFPQIRQLDVWATIPVAPSEQTAIESTVFSVSADRDTYDRIAVRTDVTDLGFLASFGRIWIAPQVPR